MRVLLVEDDPEVASVIADGLSEWGMSVAREATFAGGRSRAMMSTFDVIVLDVMLPRGDGFELGRGLRQRGVASPVLMLTARDAVDDRVRGLEAGADDYLTKPFAVREVVSRARARACGVRCCRECAGSRPPRGRRSPRRSSSPTSRSTSPGTVCGVGRATSS